MAPIWLRTQDGRVWEVSPGSEEAKRLRQSGAEVVRGPTVRGKEPAQLVLPFDDLPGRGPGGRRGPAHHPNT